MPDTTTTNYEFVKPEPGASNDTWGDKINANFDEIDALLKEAEDAIAGCVEADGLVANSVLAKNSLGQLAAITLAEGEILGRRTGAEIAAISLATLKTDLGLNNVENYSRAQLKTYFDTIYTGSGTVTGQPPHPLLTEISVEGIAANQFFVGDGDNSLAKKTITPFMAALMASADGAAALNSLGGAKVKDSNLAQSGHLTLTVAGADFTIQWGWFNMPSSTVYSLVYPKAYSEWSVCLASGGSSSSSNNGNVRVATTTKTVAQFINSTGATVPTFYLALGK